MEKENKQRKVLNPYDKIDGHNFFACSSKNEFGLKMEFFEEDEYIICNWLPQKEFEGFHNVLHGGIQSTLLDEIASWTIQIKLKTSGVTSKLETRYRNPVYCDKGKIRIRSKILRKRKNIIDVHAAIIDSEGTLCTEATITYFIFSEKIAKEKFYYPDYASFFQTIS